MFVRVKKVKGREYGYLVENVWTINGSRQRVKKYLGPVARAERKLDIEHLAGEGFHDCIRSIAEAELLSHGFERKGSLLCNGPLTVDIANLDVLHKGRKAVVAMNEGFLCSETLKQLLEFEPAGGEDAAGSRLANALLEAGLKTSNEHFVELFEKAMAKIKPKEL